MSVKLKSPPRCETPAIFRGMFVRKLKVGEDLHCDTQVQPLLELKPDQDQVSAGINTTQITCVDYENIKI